MADWYGSEIQRGASEAAMKGMLKLAYKLLVNGKVKFARLLDVLRAKLILRSCFDRRPRRSVSCSSAA